jgi:hypothetical protein
MKKIILLDDYFPTGEQTIQPGVVWHNGRPFTDVAGGVTKTAGEALDYIKNVKPVPGKTLVLVLALGAEEAYGPNRNGDGFPEKPVKAKDGKGYWVEPGEELVKHYKTFENGHAFQHHVNKDPAKASGKVLKSFWNDKMKRVELLVAIDNDKDPEWVNRLSDGEFPAVSMGCKITHDVCSICGNRAKTRAQYCDHAKFQMNNLLPDGRRVYVHNPSPNFFDISRVFRPADRTGYTLKKVAYELHSVPSAELGELTELRDAKRAAINKLSDIDKIIKGTPVAAKGLTDGEAKLVIKYKDYQRKTANKALPTLSVGALSNYKLAEVLGAFSALGVTPSIQDTIQLFTTKVSGYLLSDLELTKAAALAGEVYDTYAQYPELLDEIVKTGAFTEVAPDKETLDKLGGILSMGYRNFVPEGSLLRDYEPATTDVLTVTSPDGRQYKTTRGAARDAHDELARAQMRKMVGGGALLAGGYKLLKHAPGLNSAALPMAALGMGYGLKGMTPDYSRQLLQADDGTVLPKYTENVRVAAFTESTLRDYGFDFTALRAKVASDKALSDVLDKKSSLVESTLVGTTDAEQALGIEVPDLDKLAFNLGRLICG